MECKICTNILNLRKLTTEQRKQLLELLEAQDQQALEKTDGYRQKFFSKRPTRTDMARYIVMTSAWARRSSWVQGGVRSTRLGVAEEGCVVSSDGALSTTAGSKLGLAFVAWARATRWEKKHSTSYRF